MMNSRPKEAENRGERAQIVWGLARNPSLRGQVDERGAVLILALVYILVIGVVITALSTWAVNDLNNSTKFQSVTSLQAAASDMMEVAIQYVRYTPVISNSQTVGVASPLVACWGGDSISALPYFDGDQIAVWCSTVWQPLSQTTRTVTFYACPSDLTADQCAQTGNTLLEAVVVFDDYPSSQTVAPIQALCTIWCGQGMTIDNWVWGSSSKGSVSGIPAAINFTIEPSPTSVGVTTSAQVVVDDAHGNPVAGSIVTIAVQSGPGNLDSSSTLSATTNTSGQASFTNLVPDFAGSYRLVAVDGSASAISTNFTVSKGANSITITSTAPAQGYVGGATYTPSATATSGDTVAITVDSSSNGACTLSGGVVHFASSGTCTLDFNDSGNANYLAATQVTQSFPVVPDAATQVAITANPSSATASATTNVTLTLTLEDATGTATSSSGTTTLALSNSGGGFFANASGSSGASTLNVSFANGVSTATTYFGGKTSGSVTITAKNGGSTWGTTSVTVNPGAAAAVAITPAPTSPAASATTNTTLSLQLEDQFGNPTTSSGTTTLQLSDSGGGFFATSSGSSGASTLNVSFASGVGTATAYYGNENSGSDTITGSNGSTSWGTVQVTVQSGGATQVVLTASPASPSASGSCGYRYCSTTTNTALTIQLEDQFGNPVASTGTTSLQLSDTNGGVFSTRSGQSGSSTLTVNITNGSSSVTVYYGNSNKGSDTITATNQSNLTGTLTLTVQ